MKVIISCCGWFHARHAAFVAEKSGMLSLYITTNPRYSKVSPKLTKKIPLIENIHAYGIKLTPSPLRQLTGDYLNRVKKAIFDELVSKYVDKNSRIFHGFTALQPKCYKKARDFGMKTIVDWGIAHPHYNESILSEEYKLYGIQLRKERKYWKERKSKEFAEADFIMVPSNFVKDTFIAAGENREKILLNPFGVDLPMFYPKKKTDNKFRIIFATSLMPRRGIIYLLQAVKELRLKNSELLLVGGIRPEYEKVMKAVLHKYSGLFRYVGWSPHSELVDYYSNASIFVNPSLSEGSSYWVYEAMACGIPGIVTPNAGTVINDSVEGYIFPIRNVQSLKEKILLLYENEELKQHMGRNALETAKRMTWEAYGERLINSYKRICGDR